MKKEHKFDYNWTLKDAVFTKDKGKVFSCFACGGGSSFGYKLAGFDVIGHNDIDTKMIEVYKANHNPKYSFHESITTFAKRNDLPKELYELDILDGSPPCSSFSMAGNREKDWGKEKKFREGQEFQVLDTLFFDFIDLAKELQPKVVVAENVKGLLLGNAIRYVTEIYDRFDKAGYYCQHFLLNASKMGVPQRRERVFFICLRKDLAKPFLRQMTLFDTLPYIKMEFKEKEITYKEIEHPNTIQKNITHIPEGILPYWRKIKEGRSCSDAHEKGHYFQELKLDRNRALPTLRAGSNSYYHYEEERRLYDIEIILGGSYPKDYNFLSIKPIYLIGMSVPPVMTAQIASNIYEQWLSKI
jgi:DNA (cytosine-5)-methyltransferase 1